jgi:hypothetical protein
MAEEQSTQVDVEAQIEDLRKTIQNLSANKERSKDKSIWDKLPAISGVLQGVVIASLGLYATYTYNNRQLEQSKAAQKAAAEMQEAQHKADLQRQVAEGEATRALQKSQADAAFQLQRAQAAATSEIQRIEVIDKFFSRFGSKDARERRAAFEVILTLDPKLTATLLESFQDLDNPYEIQGYEDIILRLEKSSDLELRSKAKQVLSRLQLPRRIQAVINVFEGGREQRRYDVISPKESHDFYYGASSTRLMGGELRKLVETYVHTPQGLYGELLTPYLSRLAQEDKELAADEQFRAALQKAGNDPVMQAIQDSFFDQMWWVKSLEMARELGIKTPLGIAVIYDTNIAEGFASVTRYSNNIVPRLGGTPLTGIDERYWVVAFLNDRKQRIEKRFSRFPGMMRRTDALLELARSGNWNLTPPIRIGATTISK